MIIGQIKTLLTQAAATLKNQNASSGARLPTAGVTDKKTEEQQASTRVTLSVSGKRQLQALQMLKPPDSVNDAKKSAARAKAAQLKQQIDTLKEVAAKLGPMAAQHILRQIKQIAQQIRQVAAELAPSSSAPPAFTLGSNAASSTVGGADQSVDAGDATAGEAAAPAQAAPEVSVETETVVLQQAETGAETGAEGAEETARDQDAEQVAGQAEQAATDADKEIGNTEKNGEDDRDKGITSRNEISSQHRATGAQEKQDAEMVRDLSSELRKLLGWVKSMLQHPDKEDKKALKEIEKQLETAEKLAEDLDISANEHISSADELSATDSVAGEVSTAEVGSVDTAVSADSASAASISVLT
jgi:hypothetical protein